MVADRLLLVELPEAELLIEIEDDEKLVSGPAVSGGHERVNAEMLKC